MPAPDLPADPRARGKAKAVLLRDAEANAGTNRLVGRVVTYRGIDATLTQPPVVRDDGALVLVGRAWVGNGKARRELVLDLPFVIVNPPVLVDDPAGDIDVGGGRKARYDALAALRDIVFDALARFV